MSSYKDTEIAELISLCRLHNDEAFDELVSRYTPMLYKVAASFSSSGLSRDELFCEACVALHLAAEKFDLTQDEVTFGLFARICVRNRLVDLLRKSDKANFALDCEIEDCPSEESCDAGLIRRETFRELLCRARAILSDYEYRVLLFHIGGYKTKEIAAALGRSVKSVDNAKNRIFRRLRESIPDISDF